MKITIVAFKPLARGTLRGFADLQIEDLGLTIYSCVVHRAGADGEPWVGLPGRPLVGADGTVMKDERGKVRYDQVAKWANRAASDEFRRAAIHALKQAFPAALNADEEAPR